MRYVLFYLLFLSVTIQGFCQNDTLRGIPLLEGKIDISISNPIYNNGNITYFVTYKDSSAVLDMVTMDTCGTLLNIKKNRIKEAKKMDIRSWIKDYSKRNIAIKTKDEGFFITLLIDDTLGYIKLDKFGAIIFYKKMFIGSPIESIELQDGYMCVSDYDPDPPSAIYTALIKVDNQGKNLWQYRYGPGAFIGFNELSDTSYHLLQNIQNSGIGDLYHLNKNGKINKKVSDSIDAYAITGLYINQRWILTKFDTNSYQGMLFGRDGLVAIDNNFKKIWASKVPTLDPLTKQFYNLGIFNLYYINNTIYAHTIFSINNENYDHEGLIAFDTLGKVLWIQQDTLVNYSKIQAKSLQEYYMGIAGLPSGNVIAFGASYTEKDKKQVVWFSKFDRQGRYAKACQTLRAQNEIEEQSWSIFPNPNNNYFEVKNESMETDYSIQIYNVLGILQYSALVNQATIRIETDKWQNGIYSYVISQKNVVKQVGKWIKIN